MIKHIGSLDGMGVFQGFSTIHLNEFEKRNLIYGLNGCGKSTLSLLFKAIEDREVPSPARFPNAKFEVVLNDGALLGNGNLDDADFRVATFNRAFIEANIDWNNVVKSVLLVAKESIQDQKQLAEVRARITVQVADLRNQRERKSAIDKQCADILTSCAKRIKRDLQLIDTSDTKYLNYNKTKLEQLLRSDSIGIADGAATLNDNEFASATASAKPAIKDPIQFAVVLPEMGELSKAHGRIVALVNTTVASNLIDRLANDAELQNWVYTGIGIHESRQTATCEFCGSELVAQRWMELRQHFSDEFRNFKSTLNRASDWLGAHVVPAECAVSSEAIYDELRVELAVAREAYFLAACTLNGLVESWRTVVHQKEENPFATDLQVAPIDGDIVRQYRDAAQRVMAIVEQHNKKTENFSVETARAKRLLERHCASSDLRDADYFGKMDVSKDLVAAILKSEQNLQALRKEAEGIEVKIVSEKLGAEEFNRELHRFLGRSDIALRFNSSKNGYDIVRGGEDEHDGNLSEGEKTAIAFVLFVTKLGEGGARIEDTVVVIDDPVSSFDSSHLFNAYAFTRERCGKARQLFILTHNFTFFKLVRDWMKGRKRDKASFYLLEAGFGAERRAELKNAHASLMDYDSEYHYLFSKLYQLHKRERLTADEAYLAANMTRKLLEAFFAFKFPKHRQNLHDAFTRALSGCEVTTKQTSERIYRFINRYSHSRAIEVNDESLENLLGEAPAVINDVFEWVKEVDEVHYLEMQAVAVSE